MMQDMRSTAERAEHYRYRAEELRTIAGEWTDIRIRAVLGGIAKNYEHLAEQVEKYPPPPEPSP